VGGYTRSLRRQQNTLKIQNRRSNKKDLIVPAVWQNDIKLTITIPTTTTTTTKQQHYLPDYYYYYFYHHHHHHHHSLILWTAFEQVGSPVISKF